MELELDFGQEQKVTNVAPMARIRGVRQTKFEHLYTEYLMMEQEQARQAGKIGYVAQVFVHAALPYRKPMDDAGTELEFWQRSSGMTKLVIQSGARLIDTVGVDRNGRPVNEVERIGIPFGSFPRILLAFLTSEVVLKKSPEIELGKGVRDWFERLGIRCTGGDNGTIRAVRMQLDRLLNAKISVTEGGEQQREGQFLLAEGQQHGPRAWWFDAQKKPSTNKTTTAVWQPRIMLSPTFFESLKNRAVPVNLRAMNALSQSPMAMDLFVWLSYRSDMLRKETLVPWIALWNQFGSDSAMNKFQENVRRALRQVQRVYPEVKVEPVRNGLVLRGFPASVPRLA